MWKNRLFIPAAQQQKSSLNLTVFEVFCDEAVLNVFGVIFQGLFVTISGNPRQLNANTQCVTAKASCGVATFRKVAMNSIGAHFFIMSRLSLMGKQHTKNLKGEQWVVFRLCVLVRLSSPSHKEHCTAKCFSPFQIRSVLYWWMGKQNHKSIIHHKKWSAFQSFFNVLQFLNNQLSICNFLCGCGVARNSRMYPLISSCFLVTDLLSLPETHCLLNSCHKAWFRYPQKIICGAHFLLTKCWLSTNIF